MMNSFLFLVLGTALPILLWPVEYFLPFLYIIEELVKFLSLWWWRKNHPRAKSLKSTAGLKLAVLFALLFTFSESMLYMFNLFMLGQVYLLPKRLLLTGLLHTTTVLVLFVGGSKSRFWQAISLLTAVSIHYIYNYWIAMII